jgi:hypothetical protein
MTLLTPQQKPENVYVAFNDRKMGNNELKGYGKYELWPP